MIDTVVLTLPNRTFYIDRPDLFSPNCSNMLNTHVSGAVTKSIQNPSKEDFLRNKYMPRLTLYSRPGAGGRQVTLKVEFSAPKMIFGNNFDELVDSDFSILLSTLRDKLSDMGVKVTLKNLSNAPVSAIHYSKNIVLDDFSSCSMIISELGKIDLSSRLDLSNTDFRNNGHILRFHANSFELVFYDKLKDLEQARKSEKRAFEKDCTYQMDIFDALRSIKPFEVLRMEFRLCKKSKIKSILEQLDLSVPITFESLVSKRVACRILLRQWELIAEKLNIVLIDASCPIDLLEALHQKFPNKTPSSLLKMLGAILAIQTGGVRGMRTVLNMNGKNGKAWYVLRNQLKEIDVLKANQKFESIQNIPRAIRRFKSLKLSNYNLNLS